MRDFERVETKVKFALAMTLAFLSSPVAAGAPGETTPNPAFAPESLGLRPSYRHCIDAVDPPGATFPMLDCNAAESEYQHERLNGVYRDLIATLPEEHVAILRNEERAWLSAMRAICGSLWNEGATSGTGQAGRLVASTCEMEEVALRAALLEQRLAGLRWKQMSEMD